METPDHASRLETLTVGDIMIPIADYPKVPPEATLREAMLVMEAAQIVVAGRSSLPRVLLVMKDHAQLLGHIRRRDVMRGLEPKFLLTKPLEYRKKWFDVGIDPLLSELSAERLVKEIRERAERPVTDILLPMKGSILTSDPIMTAYYEMQGLGVPLVPVMTGDRVLGVVRTVEIFRELARLVM
ncbi:MAG: CBS domain-containing protein [Planctomycetota bacterium]